MGAGTGKEWPDMSDFSIISFDTSLLSSYYSAKTNLRVTSALSTGTTSTSSTASASDITTPWDTEDDRSLGRRYSEVKNLKSFINLNDDEVKLADGDKDVEALFALYTALEDLKTIAEYAASDSTADNLLEKLSAQYNSGITEIKDYITGLDLDKITLFSGEKGNAATSGVALGKDTREYVGAISSYGTHNSAISGIQGDEVFTITLTDSSGSDDVVIDLSQIDGTISMKSLTDYINGQIATYTEINGNGEEVGKYNTRFKYEEVEDDKYSLVIDTYGSETVALSAAVADPALYLVGSTHKGTDGVESGAITTLRDEGTAASVLGTDDFYATDAENPLHEIKDEEGELIEQDPAVEQTFASASATDSQGNLYVLGTTTGDFGSQINTAETSDVYLTKFDSTGKALWSRLVGAADEAEGFDLVIDGEDNIVIAGQVNSELEEGDVYSGQDSFVAKYDNAGTELWLQQLDTVATDSANALAVDASGNIYVTGEVRGALNAGVSHGGGQDAYLIQIDGSTGDVAQTAQFGGSGTESGQAMAIDADGNILVASEEDGQAVIRVFDSTDLTSQISSYSLGDLNGGGISALAVDGTNVYLAGSSTATSFAGGGTIVNGNSGGRDGFVVKLSNSGGALSADWTSFLGSSSTDNISDLKVANGNVYVAGTTKGALPGDARSGYSDAFAARLNGTSGAADWHQQVGKSGSFGTGAAIAFSQDGVSVLSRLGLPTGEISYKEERDIATQTTAREGDYFFISVNGGAQRKIKIDAGDDFYDLEKKINRVSASYLNASVSLVDGGPRLKIATKNGGEVELIAGAGSEDALRKLGLEPTRVLSTEELFNVGEEALGTDPDNLGGAFALKIDDLTLLRSKQEAEYIANQLGKAMDTISRAYRSLFYDPVKAEILRSGQSNGTAPAYLSQQISNYQAGLSRLQAGISTSLYF